MGIKMTQTCEMCGRQREIKNELDQDNLGWRRLDDATGEATLCKECVKLIVSHARLRAFARRDRNDMPEGLTFWEAQPYINNPV
jgi:hypothetical protein